MKTCRLCLVVRPLLEFHKKASNKDGRESSCKSCRKVTHKAWYEANKDHVLEAQKTRLLDPAFHASHKQAVRSWTIRNTARVSAFYKRYYPLHKAEYLEASRRRRARKRAAQVTHFTALELDARMSVFGHQCAYCAGPFEEVDHVIPLALGGLHWLANLRPACRACNRRKWAKPIGVWLSEVA